MAGAEAARVSSRRHRSLQPVGLVDALRNCGLLWRRSALLALVAVLLVTGDVVWDWGSRAPALVGLVTNLLLVLLLAASADAVMKSREERRLTELSRIMYRALAQLAFDGQRRLTAFVSGAALELIGIPEWDAELTAKVRRILEEAGERPDMLLEQQERRDRLRKLLHVHSFVTALYLDVSVYKRRVHDVFGMWAPALVTSMTTTQDLRRIRNLSDSLGHLHQAIYHGAATVVDDWQWQAYEPWVATVVEAMDNFLLESEEARAFYHGLAEERRRLRDSELEDAVAVTKQRPLFITQSRANRLPSAPKPRRPTTQPEPRPMGHEVD